MAQPDAYIPSTSFLTFELATPLFPGQELDAEFGALRHTTDEIRANLALIQRDDGALANSSVGIDQLDSSVILSLPQPSLWVTGKAYTKTTSLVFNDSNLYRCLISHTSGTFATDLAAGRWEMIAHFDIALDAELSALAALVSAADKLPYFTGSGAAALAGFTAFGRSLVDDVDAATARATLGLVIGTNVEARDTTIVRGPASATDNAIARFDMTTGKLIQNSPVTVSDTGAISAAVKGHYLGIHGGNAYNTALATSDANIVLYDIGAGNWAGLGVDASGNLWIRTGLSGTPAARFSILNDGTVNIGTAVATTINGNTITTGTGTLTLGAGKTFTSNNTLTLSGTDGSSIALGAGGTVAYQGGTLAQFAATTSAQLAGVISDETGSGALVFATSPALVSPSLGAATATTINGNTITTGTGTLTLGAGKTLTASNTLTLTGTDGSSAAFGAGGIVAYQGGTLAQFAATTSAQLAGIISDETGSGPLVFGTSPALATPAISGGTATGLTGLAIRSSGTGAFDLTFANTENLTLGRTLTLKVNDAARTIDLGGNLTLAGAASLPAVAQGDIWYGSAAGVVSPLAKDITATRYLANTGASNNPAWAQVNLANGVIGNLPPANLNSGTGASATTYWRGDGTWGTPPGAGDVVGPASATDNALVRFDLTSGKLVQNSSATLDDAGYLFVTRVRTNTSTSVNGGVTEAVSSVSGEWVEALQGVDRGTLYLITGTSGYTNYYTQGTLANAVGSISITTTATSYATSSDARLKPVETRTQFTGARDIVDRLRVLEHGWVQDPDARSLGLIAQDTWDVYPDIVTVGDTDDVDYGHPDFRPWGVDYAKLTPLLLADAQETHAALDRHKVEIAELEERIGRLELLVGN